MSLLNTRMQNMRSKANLDQWVLRPSRYGAFNFFQKDTNAPNSIITSDLKAKAEQSIGFTLQTPVFDFDGAVSISNSRSTVIADSENTSQLVTLTFSTFSWGFTQIPTLFHNNELGAQEDWDFKFLKYLYEFADTVDSTCATALATAKTQIHNDLLVYDEESNVVVASLAQEERIIGDINPMQSANDFYGQMNVIGNTGFESIVRRLEEKGLYNETNKQIQYSDKILHFTNNIANAAGHGATFFAAPSGSVGLLYRFEREALNRSKSRTGHEWDIETLPLLNIPVGTYYYESVGDYNAIAGAASADMTRAHKQHFGFSVDICFVTSYNQDPTTYESPIMALAIRTT